MRYVVLYDPAPPVRTWRDIPPQPVEGHLVHMIRLHASGQVLEVGSEEAAWELVRQDPAYRAGLVAPRIYPWDPVRFA